MIHQTSVLQFPIARRLANCHERVFDGNARFKVDADTTDDQLNGIAEKIVAEDGLLVDVSVYAAIRVGLGKARDRARARQAGIAIDEAFFGSLDNEMMEVAVELYELRHG